MDMTAPPEVVRPPSDPRRVEELLWWIAHATSPLVGDEFLQALVTHLARRLDLSEVFVAECVDRPATRVRTLAFWGVAGLRKNIEFELRGTPCEDTIRGRRVCWIPEGVETAYPREAGRGRESYYGIPIFEPGGDQVIGHLAFFDQRRMERDVFSDPVFHILATRAAAELQRRHAQERANEHLHQLAHLSRVGAMNEMASVIAHEINQPLASILTNSEACLAILRRDASTSPEVLEALESMASEAERAGRVIRHLRSFVRKGQGCVESVDVKAILREAADLARIEARRANVSLDLDAEGAPLPARVEQVQIEQVVLNLIRNSIEALRLREGRRQIVVRAVAASAERIEVSVSDTGPGVDPCIAPRLFEPFFTTKPSGMGMGLAICRSIVESHGGRLWLDQPSGAGGATFRFSLPCA